MLSHPIEEADLAALDPQSFAAEWKWDGIRVQAAAGRCADGRKVAPLFTRTGEDISLAFPDLVEAFAFEGALDGELARQARRAATRASTICSSASTARPSTAKLLDEYPALSALYDLLVRGGGGSARASLRRAARRLERLLRAHPRRRASICRRSLLLELGSRALARDPLPSAPRRRRGHRGRHAEAPGQSPMSPGRPKGLWFKWKRDPMLVDAV